MNENADEIKVSDFGLAKVTVDDYYAVVSVSTKVPFRHAAPGTFLICFLDET